jgi:exopolysaccharide biosynthesis WecB/TagA/CpsF family protein
MSPLHLRRLLGVDFFIGPLHVAVDRVVGKSAAALVTARAHLNVKAAAVMDFSSPASLESTGLSDGGLVVAPSAPGLADDLVHSAAYRQALQSADLVLTDSGFMVLLWFLLTGERLPRHSGLKFLRAVLERPELKEPGAVFWVMPSAEEDIRNRAWLNAHGFPVTVDDVYIAPHYQPRVIEDAGLVRRLEIHRPQIVMLAIGGGVQERLGATLRDQLSYRPAILCLGAAIAFLTGSQTAIPPWADRFLLGWLLRLISNPRRFWRRYWTALRLAPLLCRYREQVPPLAKA